MRLGFDLDGTVADLHSALTLEARRLFPDIDPAAIPNSAFRIHYLFCSFNNLN